MTLIISPTAQLESAVLLTPWPSIVVDRAVSLVFHGRHENDHTGRSDDRVAQFIYSVHHRLHFRHGIVSGDIGDPNLHESDTSFRLCYCYRSYGIFPYILGVDSD